MKNYYRIMLGAKSIFAEKGYKENFIGVGFLRDVDLTGKLPDNLRMERINIDPSAVQIIGGRQILKNITTLYTEKIPLESIQSSRTIIVNLALSPASLKVAPGFKDKITVVCIVKELSKNDFN